MSSNVHHRFVRIAATACLVLAIAMAAPMLLRGLRSFGMASAATMTGTHSIRLPLYSSTGKQRYATVDYGPQTSPYVKTGSAQVVVRANVDQVTAWYLSTMPKHGYRLQSKTINGGRSGLGQVLDFVEKNNSGFDVTVTFSSLVKQPQDLAIGYTVTNTITPARSADSMIPSNVKRVVIHYEPASTSGTSPVIERTISNPPTVAALVHAVNTLSVDIRGPIDERPMYQGGATLQFADGSHYVITVKLDMALNRVIVGRTSPLFDIQNHVWAVVSKDMGFAPYPPKVVAPTMKRT